MSKNTTQSIKVWDLLIRIFHWSLVVLFFIAYLTEDDWMLIHSYAGYTIALLVLFRLVWGAIGTYHARFTNFVVGPAKVKIYLKQLLAGKPTHYLGHNPAGAVMIVILLLSVFLATVTGMSLYATEGQGPLVGTFLSSWSEELLEEIHEFFANLTLFMVFVHVAGAIVSSFLHNENLVKAMITGEKTSERVNCTGFKEDNCLSEKL